jgi:MoxR-like ATPase
LGYPDPTAERALLAGQSRQQLLEALTVQLPPEQLQAIQQAVLGIHVSPALLDYCQALIHYTRTSPEYPCGLSPRGGLALLRAAKAWAFMHRRDAVLPEDVQAVLAAVAGHRLRAGSSHSEAIVASLLDKVAIH